MNIASVAGFIPFSHVRRLKALAHQLQPLGECAVLRRAV